MKNTLKIMLLVISFFCANQILWAQNEDQRLNEKNYFQFVIPKYHTTRQGGQTVSIYLRYAYKKDLSPTAYPDYRNLRSAVLNYMEPSEDLPFQVFWEILASNIGKELMHDYPLSGVSVQLEVLDNQSPDAYEPSDHGPTFTLGDIPPLAVHH